MIGFKLNTDKAVNTLLYVSKILGNDADFHKTYKILYFADQMHLAKYGRPIVGDMYVKMKFGPVPSFMRNVIDGNIPEFSDIFQVENSMYIKPLAEPNLDYLSETDIECLDISINENKGLSFKRLTDKSHDFAWNNTNWQLDYEDIFKAVSNDDKMLNYVKTNMLNNNITLV